jgi:hypothetical protein
MSRMIDLDGVVKTAKSVVDKILGKDKKNKKQYAEDDEEES